MLLGEASGSNVKVLPGSLRKTALCQNYSAKPSAKPRCCSAMEELQDSLFKDFFSSFTMSWIPEKSLLIPGFSWRSLGTSHMATGKPTRGAFLYRAGHLSHSNAGPTEPEETHPGSPERWLGTIPITIFIGHRQDRGSWLG